MTGPLSIPRKLLLAREVLVSYAAVRWLLWRYDVREALRRLRGRGTWIPVTAHPPARLRRALLRTLWALPTDSRCLVQSLVLLDLLQQRGVHTELIIGVEGDSVFAAHAWIESDGVPLLPTGGERFGQLARL